jgi:hypothetical protein
MNWISAEQTQNRLEAEQTQNLVAILSKVCKRKPPDWKGGQSGGIYRHMEFSEFLLHPSLGFR